MIKGMVSIIVPVYNAEKYLKQCIESIINQTYKNIELILINDGSTDNSSQICMFYAKRDRRIKYFYQKNAGAATARNVGLDKCSGEYIGFVDSDDYVDLDMYEILVTAIKESDAQVAQILSRRVMDDGNVLNQELLDRIENQPAIFYNTDQAIKHYLIGNHSLCCHIYMAAMFNQVRLPEGMSGEDLAIIIPLYSQCENVIKINMAKYNYRFNQKSVTNAPLNQRKLNLFFEFEKQLQQYSTNQFYIDIIIFSLSKSLSGIINAMILQGNTEFETGEKYFREKLKKYINTFEENVYISRGQITKYHLYLKSRFIYVIILKIKRKFFYKRKLYGEE